MDTFPAHMTVDPTNTAQLFWDSQDPESAGWTLRYWTADGNEHSAAVEGAEDDELEQLSEAVAVALDGLDLSGTLRIVGYRGDQPFGRITISNETGIAWRYV